MPNSTTHYGLIKPLPTEAYDVTQFNANADKLDAALFKKIELGADGKVLTSQLPDDIDCGTFDALTPVAAHNESPKAHAAMTVDGNAVVQASGGELAAHETDPLAHQNIILDGNIN